MYLNKMFYFELIEIFLFLCDLKGFIYNIFLNKDKCFVYLIIR